MYFLGCWAPNCSEVQRREADIFVAHTARTVNLSMHVYETGEEEVGFVSNSQEPYTHEHYIKVVSTTFIPLRGKPEHAYEYTINSNMYPAEGESSCLLQIPADFYMPRRCPRDHSVL